jgi:hypothetical protein
MRKIITLCFLFFFSFAHSAEKGRPAARSKQQRQPLPRLETPVEEAPKTEISVPDMNSLQRRSRGSIKSGWGLRPHNHQPRGPDTTPKIVIEEAPAPWRDHLKPDPEEEEEIEEIILPQVRSVTFRDIMKAQQKAKEKDVKEDLAEANPNFKIIH